MKQAVVTLGLIWLAGACSSSGGAPNPTAPAPDTDAAAGAAHDTHVGAGLGGQGGGGASAGAGGAAGASMSEDASRGGADGGGAGGGSDSAPMSNDGAAAETAAAGSAPWPSVDDYTAHGPFPTMRQTNTGPGAAYDIFRPTELGAEGRKHPIISWANGTLYNLDSYGKLLDHWASHGFVVIAGHTNTTAGGGTHKAGIDWLVAENVRSGGPYFGRLDSKRIGAAGHSQGGGATIAAGSNKPGVTGIVATLPLMPLLSFEADQTIVAHQTAPMFNINATMDDRDATGKVAAAIFVGANAELVQAAFIGMHTDAMNPAMHGPTLAWFRLRLMDDPQAKPWFYPAATCGLCRDAAWKQVRSKNLPP